MEKRKETWRAKRADNGEWTEGFYIYHHDNPCITSRPFSDFEHHEIIHFHYSDWDLVFEERHKVIASTLGRCLGRTDKVGRMVFEGDIIRDNFPNAITPYFIDYLVCFVNVDIPESWDKAHLMDVCGFNLQTMKNTVPEIDLGRVGQMEIIGNIHDGGLKCMYILEI